ncbi:peptidoglycan-binding domain-containing protein [Thalassospiraceae bacterium LMO-JJ14]|nr:peptidoglycan-binding domain-containing protein [Thalassospiraceae bacterium LMO-JJ14]
MATQQVNKQRSQIERDARQELSSIPKQNLFSPDINQPRIQPAPAPLTESKPSPSKGTVREVQKLLKELGYDPGPIDGQMGPKTRTAIKSFQREALLPPDAEIDQDFLRALRDAHSERQKFKSQQESRTGTKKFTVSEKQFLTIFQDQNGEMKLFDSTRVPFNTENSCYGWRMRINGISGSIKMREILRLPSKPLGGWPVITDGSKKVTPSSDGKSAVTDMMLEIKDDMVSHVWCIAEGDPIGDYSIDVFLDDVFVETFDFEVVKASQQAPSKTQAEAGNSPSSKQVYIPENASVDYTGKGWTCDRGYRPDGDRCVKFVVPAHASVDYTGRDWTCDRGYNQQGNQCVKFVVPDHASVDYTGRDWTCDRGYNQQGDRCIKFAVPANASIDYTGRDWTCDRGYKQQGNRCIKFAVPANARIDYTGRDWTCDRGYKQQGENCIKFAVPKNASVDYTGRNWVCNSGFMEVGDQCVR